MKFAIVVLTLAVLGAQALPATLPTPQLASDAPATIRVSAGDDLQQAIDTARPGDVISLPPGSTFTGNFVLPAKPGSRYITIRTAPTAGLPGAGARISPAHSGKLARLVSPNGVSVVRTAPGAHHWRLMLLEIGPTAAASSDIIAFGDATAEQAGPGRVPTDLIVDRCFIHGDPVRGQKRGIAINSAATTIVGSHISDIKFVGQDAQAIAGWSGPGPFRVENNYLEASGENLMLGGGLPAAEGLVPSDLVFRRNHVSRPAAWRSERWTVKNLFELKNARRVLIEGNLFETHWPDAQAGYAIVFTPRGERGRAPWSTVEDVTFRHNIVRDVSAVFNLLGKDDGGASGILRRVHITNNLFYRVDRSAWGGNGAFMLIGDGPADVVVEHNTIVQSGNVITAYGGTRDKPEAINGFVFRNNLALHNSNGVIGQSRSIGLDTLTSYFPDGIFTRNVLAGGRESRYPADNLFPDADGFASHFVDFAGHDYRLRRSSELRRAGTDGADLGVNFTGLVRALGARAREWLGFAAEGSDGR